MKQNKIVRSSIAICFFLAGQFLFSQNPMLKVYVDTKEVNKVDIPVLAFVKSSGKYYSILKTKDNSIYLPDQVEFHKIEGLKFIVKEDTITFPVSKLLEDLKNHPEKNMVDELYAIFKEISKWELRIDNFKYSNKDEQLASADNKPKKSSVYGDYKIYSLRTTNFKYYIVRDND